MQYNLLHGDGERRESPTETASFETLSLCLCLLHIHKHQTLLSIICSCWLGSARQWDSVRKRCMFVRFYWCEAQITFSVQQLGYHCLYCCLLPVIIFHFLFYFVFPFFFLVLLFSFVVLPATAIVALSVAHIVRHICADISSTRIYRIDTRLEMYVDSLNDRNVDA